VFPVLVAILATKAVRRRRDLGGAIAIVMLTAMLTPVVASSLTDGLEGSRMRFPTSFLVVVGVCWLLSPGPTDSGERGAVAGERPG
jgi:drug/metabolite transporter (DMT)-like permease